MLSARQSSAVDMRLVTSDRDTGVQVPEQQSPDWCHASAARNEANRSELHDETCTHTKMRVHSGGRGKATPGHQEEQVCEGYSTVPVVPTVASTPTTSPTIRLDSSNAHAVTVHLRGFSGSR